MKNLFIAILFMSVLCSKLNAQTMPCPPNIDFETATFSNWECYVGFCCAITTPTLTGPISGRHTLTTGLAFDPYGGFPTVAPKGGLYSIKLGNDNIGKEAERVRYYVHVPSGPGRYILVYRYAVVFEDPHHNAAEQPRFEVNAFDSVTGNPIDCAQYTYVAASKIPGFSKSSVRNDVFYKPWTMATIDLSSASGRTVAVDFASGDCALGGHFGYGYADMNCGLFQIYALQCNGSPNITLTAPEGFEHYKWMDSTLTTTIDTHRIAILPAVSAQNKYAVILTPYPGYGCPDTLYSTYVIANTDVQAGLDTTICAGGRANLNITATTTDGPLTFQWSPLKYLSCFNCPNPVAKPPKTIIYTVIATSNAGCSDTDQIKVTTDSSLSTFAQLSQNRDTVCPYEPVKVKNVFLRNPILTSYPWLTSGAMVLQSSRDSLILCWKTPGLKIVTIDTKSYDCFVTDTVFVYVRAPIPLSAPKDLYICPKDTANLTVNSSSTIPLVYMWYPNNYLTCVKCQFPKSYTPNNQQYFVTYINEGLCPDTAYTMVHLDTVDAQITILSDTICTNEVVVIKNNITQSSKHVQYMWSLNGGDMLSNDSLGKITVKWSEPGLKKVKLLIEGSDCDGKDSVNIYVLPPFTADFELPDQACQNEMITVKPVKQQFAFYHWYIDGQEIKDSTYSIPRMSWIEMGMKHVTLLVTNHYMCDSQSHTDSIPVYELPSVYLQIDQKGRICQGDYLYLTTTPDPDYKYVWKPAGAFENISGNTANMTVTKTETISVTATNEFNCSNTSEYYVNTGSCCKVLMPDAFTPNGDGKNDLYHPVGIDKQIVRVFLVANRWGQILYNSTTALGGWDGTIKGKKQDPGTYSYYLEFDCNGETHIEKGNFILLR